MSCPEIKMHNLDYSISKSMTADLRGVANSEASALSRPARSLTPAMAEKMSDISAKNLMIVVAHEGQVTPSMMARHAVCGVAA